LNSTLTLFITFLISSFSRCQSRIAFTSSNIIHELGIINGYAGEFSDDDDDLNYLRAHVQTCYET